MTQNSAKPDYGIDAPGVVRKSVYRRSVAACPEFDIPGIAPRPRHISVEAGSVCNRDPVPD